MLPAVIYDPSATSQLSTSPGTVCFSDSLCWISRAAAQSPQISAVLPSLSILRAPIPNSSSESLSQPRTSCSKHYIWSLLTEMDDKLLGINTFCTCQCDQPLEEDTFDSDLLVWLAWQKKDYSNWAANVYCTFLSFSVFLPGKEWRRRLQPKSMCWGLVQHSWGGTNHLRTVSLRKWELWGCALGFGQSVFHSVA